MRVRKHERVPYSFDINKQGFMTLSKKGACHNLSVCLDNNPDPKTIML